ncbi:hypothetical protein BZG36_02734 [Bifiguratus adelaidae]|uniref:Core Histone H2A/H2B/H3 domain-containing protein n=1 Tax=Bifiguratus adelaidae TaxID=1938954 RepID=A0A261XYY0_9FUNG|nr:hypothetical protein BZG36_02734 [Bifiguratus adelaidae]
MARTKQSVKAVVEKQKHKHKDKRIESPVIKSPPKEREKEKKKKRNGRKAQQAKMYKDIKDMTTTTKLVFPKASFKRLVREYSAAITAADEEHDFRWRSQAIKAVQEASEAYLVEVFQKCRRVVKHGGKETLKSKDMRLKTATPLPQLPELNFANSDISHIDDISACTNLRKLNLSNNKLKSPDALSGLQYLTELTTLNLSGNALESCEGLQKLKTLFGDVHTTYLTQLKALVLNHNKIKTVENIGGLLELNTLVISHNNISELPSLPALTNLAKLSAAHNAIRLIPDLSSNSSLKELRLNDNKILTVPESVRACSALEILDLGNNLIQGWKDVAALGSLLHLINLNLKGNPICQLEGYRDKILALIPSLRILDGERFDVKFLERKEKRKAHIANLERKQKSKENRQLKKALKRKLRENGETDSDEEGSEISFLAGEGIGGVSLLGAVEDEAVAPTPKKSAWGVTTAGVAEDNDTKPSNEEPVGSKKKKKKGPSENLVTAVEERKWKPQAKRPAEDSDEKAVHKRTKVKDGKVKMNGAQTDQTSAKKSKTSPQDAIAQAKNKKAIKSDKSTVKARGQDRVGPTKAAKQIKVPEAKPPFDEQRTEAKSKKPKEKVAGGDAFFVPVVSANENDCGPETLEAPSPSAAEKALATRSGVLSVVDRTKHKKARKSNEEDLLKTLEGAETQSEEVGTGLGVGKWD